MGWLLFLGSATACTGENAASFASDGSANAHDGRGADTHDARGSVTHDARPSAIDASDGSRALWNGVDLTEWDGDPKVWKAVSGVIVGSAPAGSVAATTYLILQGQPYGDFVLTGEIRLGAGGNSGIVYRSKVTNAATWVVEGDQEDIADTLWGALYVDRRGVVARSQVPCMQSVRANDYNSFEIRAVGTSLVHRLNGIDCVRYTDTTAQPTVGLIGLQYHQGGGWEVSVRNLRIREM